MTNKTRFLSDTDCGPSPVIFEDLGKLRDDSDLGKCAFFDDDFLCPTTYASATAQAGNYTYQDTSVTITGKGINDTDKELGVLQIDVLDTDNDEGSIQFGVTNQWRLDRTAGNTSKVGYEVRVVCDELAANETGIMIGMVEGPVATALSVDNTGEIKTSTSFFGFRGLATDPANLDAIYQDTGASAPVTILANAAVLVEGTYSKLGFIFNPYDSDASKAAQYVVDGVPVAYVNTTQVATSTFPEGEAMVPFVLGKTFGSGTSGTVGLDRATGFMYRNAVQG